MPRQAAMPPRGRGRGGAAADSRTAGAAPQHSPVAEADRPRANANGTSADREVGEDNGRRGARGRASAPLNRFSGKDRPA
eukprot:9303466-Alexandrium_andersonii.AAC.1